MYTKVCKLCSKSKNIDEFYLRKERYYTGKCKECINKNQKDKRNKDISIKDKKLNTINNTIRNRKYMYGITEKQYNTLFSNQVGRCLICRKHQSELPKSLAVDHCHSTGKIRGLLCTNCNIAIGYLKESIENTEAALWYLINYK